MFFVSFLMFSLSQVHYCRKIGIFFSIPFRFSLYLLSLDWYGVESDEAGVEESGLGDEKYQSYHDGNSDDETTHTPAFKCIGAAHEKERHEFL